MGRGGRSCRLLPVAASLACAAALLPPADGVAQSGSWTVRSGAIRVVCPLTVGGSFEARTEAIGGTFTPGAPPRAAGEFTVDLDTLDTGIALRNAHMRDRYLETSRGPEFATAVLTEIHLSGVDPAAATSRGSFTAALRLHGRTRSVAGGVQVRRNGPALQVRASFPVRLPEFDIPAPRYLGVGVKDEVTVHVTLDLQPR